MNTLTVFIFCAFQAPFQGVLQVPSPPRWSPTASGEGDEEESRTEKDRDPDPPTKEYPQYKGL